MDVTPLIPKNFKVIDSYGAGKFSVNDDVFEGNILIHAESCLKIDDLSKALEEYEDLLALSEIVLIGSKSLKKREISSRLTFEIMGTGAACRTYNVLLAEGRKVSALIEAI